MKEATDPFAIMSTYKGGKPPKVNPPARKHEEADLHLSFCSWFRENYPEIPFVRHEKERKRSYALQNMMLAYNALDGLTDMEVFAQSGNYKADVECEQCDHVSDYYVGGCIYQGLYIEFKKPGEKWLTKDGKIKPQYEHQYKCHQFLWSIGRPTYFCNDLEDAKNIVIKYLSGSPLAKQEY